jgi:hypothetical protein
MTKTTIQRALELAESGDFNTVDDIAQALSAEGFFEVSAHLAGRTIRNQLRRIMRGGDLVATRKPSPKAPSWTEEEDNLLRALGDDIAGRTRLARQFGRPRGSVDIRMRDLRLLRSRGGAPRRPAGGEADQPNKLRQEDQWR